MRLSVAYVLFSLAGCATPVTNTLVTQVPPSTPVRWQVASGCMATHSLGAIASREALAAACRDGVHELTALALSGGGSKAAIFSGEAMFYLQALGLLQRTSVISSVSGGSFAGALYALSCDSNDKECQGRTRPGLIRPVWQHDPVLRTLGAGYGQLVREQVVRLVVPLLGVSISPERFADVIDDDYLGRKQGADTRFTFSDLNPRRPHLFINATILSHNRGGLESIPTPGCPGVQRGYLRRRTPDEFFHFAFSDYYFGLLRSNITNYPVSAAVAASAAFPALIDNATLIDHCGATGREAIRLMDGGANDNQALIEIYLILSELALHQARSDLSVRNPGALERLGSGDRAWFIVVNSSVTESTGLPGTTGDDPPRSAAGLLLRLVDKVSSATDTYSAIGYDLRRQLYLAMGERLPTMPGTPAVRPIDISLTSLDQYALGGTEAALRTKSGIPAELTDILDQQARQRIVRQSRAYRTLVEDAGARHGLGLSDWHPQCYFDMRAQLDASLVHLNEDDQTCLREAARWSAALRAQELCNAAPGVPPPDGLDCSGPAVRLRDAEVLRSHLPGTCKPTLPGPPRPGEIRDPRATCRALDPPRQNL